MGRMQTVLKQKPSCHKYGSLAFFWIFILCISSPSWAICAWAENEPYPVIEPAETTSKNAAVKIAKEYLKITDTTNHKIKIEEKVITTKSFNTYRTLELGINRTCWVVTLIVPDAVGASRTVYVDKESGEILGGYASK